MIRMELNENTRITELKRIEIDDVVLKIDKRKFIRLIDDELTRRLDVIEYRLRKLEKMTTFNDNEGKKGKK